MAGYFPDIPRIFCQGNLFNFNRFPLYIDAAQYMCQPDSQFHWHFNDVCLCVFTLSTKSRSLRHGTRCLVQTQTELTTVMTSFFFVSFQNWSYEISFRIPPKWLLKRLLLWGEVVLLRSFAERVFPVIVLSKVETVQGEITASLIECKMRTTLFWFITQRVAVIPHRRFGTTSSSSSCSWRVRRVSCSLILKMKFVPPSLFRSSNVPSSFSSIS